MKALSENLVGIKIQITPFEERKMFFLLFLPFSRLEAYSSERLSVIH
jgi:hypothetical protein